MRIMNRILFAASFGAPLTLGARGKLPLLPPLSAALLMLVYGLVADCVSQMSVYTNACNKQSDECYLSYCHVYRAVDRGDDLFSD